MTSGAAASAGSQPPLRVALIAGLATGGTARHVGWLAGGCAGAGLAVSVLAPAATLAAAGLQERGSQPSGIAVTTLPSGDRLAPGRDLAALARLRGWLASWQPGVVHAHGVRAGALAAAAIALLPRRNRPPLAVTVHNAPPSAPPAAAVYAALERACARRAALAWCASADLTARLRARGAAAEQFDVPARPLAPAAPGDAAAVRAEFGAAGRPLVLAAGRLAPQKGFDVLIEAAARWRDRDPRPVTVIAGDGPLAGPLDELAARSRVEVTLAGQRDDIAALLAAADVVAVPSQWEARALIVQEAMQAGRPVVATRTGGIPGLTGDDGALLVPPGDPAALAAAVTRVLGDPALAGRLAAAARERARSFPSEQAVLHATLDAYARLAG